MVENGEELVKKGEGLVEKGDGPKDEGLVEKEETMFRRTGFQEKNISEGGKKREHCENKGRDKADKELAGMVLIQEEQSEGARARARSSAQ